MSWLSRAGARLLPAGRRDWAEAVWAEAREVPPGWPRLAWRAGGVRLIVREAQMMRRIGTLLLFAAAAGAAAWGAWPKSPVSLSHGAANQGDVIITIALLAGLPLLARWFLGPPDNRAARWLRAGFYAAILAIMPAKAVAELFVGAVPRGGIDRHTFDFVTQGNPLPGSVSGGPDWGGEILILFITACYLAVILALTARRTPVAPATLAISARAGLVLGLVMYAVAPLGLGKSATNPWLRGWPIDTLVALAWVLLFSAPFVAGALAGKRCYVPDDRDEASVARAWQGCAAGLVSNGVGALTVTVLGTGTTALMLKSAWIRGWLYHGQHLTASALYGRELYATQIVAFYAVICVVFPIIGLLAGLAGSECANMTGPLTDGGGPPGAPGPEPVPDPPDGGRLADAGADQDRLLGRYDGEDAEAPPGLVGAGLGWQAQGEVADALDVAAVGLVGVDVAEDVQRLEDPPVHRDRLAERGRVPVALQHRHHVEGPDGARVDGGDDPEDVLPVPADLRKVDLPPGEGVQRPVVGIPLDPPALLVGQVRQRGPVGDAQQFQQAEDNIGIRPCI